MRTPSQRSIGGRGGPRERPLEDPFFGEPDPIVFPAKGIGRAPAPAEAPPPDDVDPIPWPPPPAETVAAPEREPEPEAEPELALPIVAPPAARPRRNAWLPGVVVGGLLGAVVGGLMTLKLTGPDVPAPAVQVASPPPVQEAPARPAQAISEPAVTAPPPPSPPVAEPRDKAVAQAKGGTLDLDRLARALGMAAPRPPPAAPEPKLAIPPPPPPPSVIAAAPAEPPPPLRSATIAPPRATEAPKIIAPPAITPPPQAKTATQRPSFDCGGASSATQQLICADADLALADRRLSLAYDAAMASSFDRPALREDQQRWFRDRDRLGADRAAVAAFYQSRITELEVKTRIDRRRGGLLRNR